MNITSEQLELIKNAYTSSIEPNEFGWAFIEELLEAVEELLNENEKLKRLLQEKGSE